MKMLPKVTFRITPAQKINILATLKKFKKRGSNIRTQDELAQAIFKRKDLMEIAEGKFETKQPDIPGFEGTLEALGKIGIKNN